MRISGIETMENVFQKILINRNSYIQHNQNQIKNEYGIIVMGLELITRTTERNIDKEKFKELSEEEQNVWWSTFTHFRIDSFNSFINSFYLMLAGCRSDAIALIRNILEAESILEYGLQFNKMKEIRKRYVFGIAKEPSRNTILKELDKDGEKRIEAWRSYSEFGSHVLFNKMQQNFSWEIGGKIEQIQGGGFLSRRELICNILILMQLLEYAIKNDKIFFEKYKDFLKDQKFLKDLDNWVVENNRIIKKCKKEFKEYYK